MKESFDTYEFSVLIADTILKEASTNRVTLLSKIEAIVNHMIDQKMVPRNYNTYVTKRKKAKWIAAILKGECELRFWKQAVIGLDPNNIQNYYDGLKKNLEESGFGDSARIGNGITCFYCERELDAAQFGGEIGIHCTMDHVIPKSKFGRSNFENLVNACNECNQLKAALSVTQFIRKLELMERKNISYKTMSQNQYQVMIKNANKLLVKR